MYVQSVSGTVKGAVNAELGPRTLIVGPNGSGKSRLVNTLELALLGYASDVVGRAEMRKEAELIALAGGSGDSLVAKATLSDGRVCQWATNRTKTGTKRAEHIKAVTAEFPVNQVREALTGSVDTARSWLLQRVAAKVARQDVTKYLPSEESEKLFQSKAKFCTGDEVEILLAVYEAGKSEKRAKSAAVTTTGKNIATLAEGLSPEPTAAQISEAAEAADRALEAYRAAVQADTLARVKPVPANTAALEQRATELAALAEQTDAYIIGCRDQLEQAGGALTPQDAQMTQLRTKIRDLMEVQVEHGLNDCIACEGGNPIQVAKLRIEQMDRANASNQLRAQHAAQLVEAEGILSRIMAEFADVVARFKEATAPVESGPPLANVDVDGAAQTLREANARRAEVERTAEAWRSVRSLRSEEREAKKAVATLEELIEGCKAAIEGILKSATQQFIDRVQSYLPSTDTFDLVLTDGEKNVCRFGFVRDGALHTALSGAEWARLTLALACACSNDDSSVLRIFVPEDRAFDPNTLRDVLESLSSAPGQVIIATTTFPTGGVPDGWTLVQTGATK